MIKGLWEKYAGHKMYFTFPYIFFC